jgi:hypothetical protein
LKELTLKNTTFEEKISHYEPYVTKKLKLRNFDKQSVTNLIKKENITLEENYNFHKKLLPDNVKLMNHLLFDLLIKPGDKNRHIILVKNTDEKFNRNSLKRLENLAKMNKNIRFYYMYNTVENINYLKEKFKNIGDILSNSNSPHLLLIKDNQISFVPQEVFLKYSTKEEEINKFILN